MGFGISDLGAEGCYCRRSRIWRGLGPWGVWFGAVLTIGGCGKDNSPAAAPDPTSLETVEPTPPSRGDSDEGGTGDELEASRLELETEFHRTRFGLGSGMWVLGVVHNPHAERVADVRVRVQLLDEGERPVGQAEGRVRRSLGPGERAGVAVQVANPVSHEQLKLRATAVPDSDLEPDPLPLRLEHEDPQRADFGGWYIVGRVENPSAATVAGARIEIQGLDKSGQLLGIDWLALDDIDPGETIEFDVGDLRYEETPASFLLQLRGPASPTASPAPSPQPDSQPSPQPDSQPSPQP